MDPQSFFADPVSDPAVSINADPEQAAFLNADPALKNFVKITM